MAWIVSTTAQLWGVICHSVSNVEDCTLYGMDDQLHLIIISMMQLKFRVLKRIVLVEEVPDPFYYTVS